MTYFFDFDRTVFDTESFKHAFKERVPFRELRKQFREVIAEAFHSDRTLSRRKVFARTAGTYASHRRFTFPAEEVQKFMYPDAIEFFKKYGKDCTIVTYGVRAFITAKVASALSEFELNDIVYTHRRKGRTIRRLTKDKPGPFTFVDDAHFQLHSVAKTCPEVSVIEIRRDGKRGEGTWPVIHSLDELQGA